MKKKKVLKYIKKHSDDKTLEGEVCEWLTDYDDYDSVCSALEDLSQYGCQSGMVGKLVYYNDTTTFYSNYKEEIWELAEEQAEELGHDNALEMISKFNGYRDGATQFENIMAWYSFEETARNLANKFGIEV